MLGEWDVLIAKAGGQGGLLVTVSRVLAGCKWFFCVCEGGPFMSMLYIVLSCSLAWGLQFGFARVFCTAGPS